MATTAYLLASGPGWRAEDVVCTAGPRDRPFEEQHESICMAAVTAGHFRYRTQQGTAILAPGAVLLGNDRHCFECDHQHSTGDRCLSFHFTPEFLESIVAAVPGAGQITFAVPRLPPLPSLMPIMAAAEVARDDGDKAEFEELALRFAGAVVAALTDTRRTARTPSRRDERRVAAALRRIERHAHEHVPLADLARDSATSPYHFLRIFRQVVGMTPYQFLLRTRLHRAAVELRRSDDNVAVIALNAGFNDVSEFNRRFKRITGSSPSVYRRSSNSAFA